jgi:hypothetical protein
MGQLNFFITKDEIKNEIDQLLISKEYTLFKEKFFDSKFPQPVSAKSDLTKTDKMILWINHSLSKPNCSSKGGGEMKGKFLFDLYKDPVIEFDLGKTTGKLISPGRLYYKTGWIEKEELRKLHTKLTNRLVRTFKKKLNPIPNHKPFYISEETIALLNKGYELELGEGGMRVNKNILINIKS